MAKIVISFGGAGREAYDPGASETHQKLDHKIALTSETETLNFSFKGNTTFEAYVAPGNWNIRVDSFLEGVVYATGSKDVILKLGQNNETLLMYEAFQVTFDSNGGSAVPGQIVSIDGYALEPSLPDRAGYKFDGWYADGDLRSPFYFKTQGITGNITLYAKWTFISDVPGSSLDAQLNWLYANAVDGGDYTVTVSGTENISGQKWLGYKEDIIKVNITLTGGGTVIFNKSDTWFNIASKVKLTLENITLTGFNNNNRPVVCVNGELVINEGVLISGNINVSDGIEIGSAGGVLVSNGGNFTMNGGTITGNTGQSGGGVYVWNGTFYMEKDAIITGNTCSDWGGGGVTVTTNGIFIMDDGTISGNTAKYGGGVNVGDEGSFTMNEGIISGNKAESYGTAESCGGGVFVSDKGTFSKSGGIIYGYSPNAPDDPDSNVVKVKDDIQSDRGHAAYVFIDPAKRRETTAGPGVFLSYDAATGNAEGEWDKQ